MMQQGAVQPSSIGIPRIYAMFQEVDRGLPGIAIDSARATDGTCMKIT
jgi:hypothetical protein